MFGVTISYVESWVVDVAEDVVGACPRWNERTSFMRRRTGFF